jgi:hypothetical protein
MELALLDLTICQFKMKTFFLLLLAGVISTAVMDAGALLFRSTKITAGLPLGLMGKWFKSVENGRVFVDDVRTCEGAELPIIKVLFYHYGIGIFLAFLFYGIISIGKIGLSTSWITLLYGLGTTLIPGLFMFPAMGFGFFGLSGPAEYLLFRTALVNHLLYGLGLVFSFHGIFKRHLLPYGSQGRAINYFDSFWL